MCPICCLKEGCLIHKGSRMEKHFIREVHDPAFPMACYCNKKLHDSKKLIDPEGKVDRIVVFGCGGHARSIINTIYQTYDVTDILLVDIDVREGEMIFGCKTMRNYDLHENDAFIVAVGDNNKRKNLYVKLLKNSKGCSISIVSRSAEIGIDAEMGYGTFIAPYAYMGPQARVGNNTIINTGSIIEHETVIGDHVHIAPHATVCGRSKVGNNVFCGAGSTIIDQISVCDDVVIGAGAVVTKDIVVSGTYIGIPAQRVDST